MENLLRQLGNNLLALLFALMVMITWSFWLLGRGRFARPLQESRSPVAYYIGTFVGQIITEFRHLLALVIVILFAVTMGTVIFIGRGNFEDVKAGVQLVAASMGGLIGSIIGYYFGESAAKQKTGELPAAAPPPVVQPSGPTQPPTGVSPVQPPPQAGTLS